MNNIFPNPSVAPPNLNYQFYNHTGRPTLGPEQMLTPDEFREQSQIVARACYGNFDTAQVEQKHFGRTLYEVWTLVSSQEFRLLAPPQYRWIRSKRWGVRPLVFMQWVELARASNSDVKNIAKKRSFLPGR